MSQQSYWPVENNANSVMHAPSSQPERQATTGSESEQTLDVVGYHFVPTKSSDRAADSIETASVDNSVVDTVDLHPPTPSNAHLPTTYPDIEAKQGIPQCTFCNLTFDNPCDLDGHMHRKHEGQYKCTHPGCFNSFKFKIDWKRHVQTHLAMGSRPMFSCLDPGCDKAYPRKDNMLKHFEKMHS
ncbi:uncharacterized protein K460DRAFT_398152 [Cucurbitaria berberidis CBS 394.84]|uniref:C2H2-type domain-containing protein n=1 Tax=Cucurbitaria berberidis CBS 394.84 TaxID=1168544 RepID=A0A9P4L5J9_9PLEO|nr:uncharacterized protein K460DRAFT_398152 [Cucurbitaria berberidis CBS 394.84]KAF1842063.1 hypothetical protein K460DRAFT_398152 [Cucurbitaria berberidis CBS 394.84]